MGEPTDFVFEHWARLAAEDPEEFERRRAEAIETFIAGAPESLRRRLTGLQWQVDQIRRQAKTPMAACLRLSNMMWDKVLAPNGLLDAVKHLSEPTDSRTATNPTATILAMRPATTTRIEDESEPGDG